MPMRLPSESLTLTVIVIAPSERRTWPETMQVLAVGLTLPHITLSWRSSRFDGRAWRVGRLVKKVERNRGRAVTMEVRNMMEAQMVLGTKADSDLNVDLCLVETNTAPSNGLLFDRKRFM